MRLWLIRHGKAERESHTGRDEDRPLRERGRRQAAFLAGYLAARPDRPALIISSGLVRAEETAEPLVGVLDAPHEIDPALGRFFDATVPASLADRHAHLPALALVGHNEQLSLALAEWIPGAERLRTGEMALLELRAAPSPALLERVRLPDALVS